MDSLEGLAVSRVNKAVLAGLLRCAQNAERAGRGPVVLVWALAARALSDAYAGLPESEDS